MPQSPVSTSPRAYLVRFCLLSIASVLGALLGFALLPHNASTALMWPPTAIGVAALFLFGYELWPALLLSITAVLFFRNGSLPLDVVVALSSTFEALCGAYLLKLYHFNPLINNLQSTLALLVASLCPTIISAAIVTLSSYYVGRIGAGDIETIWATVWIGHAVTCLSFAPFFIRWLHRPLFTKTKQEIAQGMVIFGALGIVSYLLFWTPHNSLGPVSLVYIVILILRAAALRSGPRGTTLGLAMVSLIGSSGVVYGSGTLSVSHNPQATFLLQVLFGVLDLIFIVIAATIEERKDVTNSLAENIIHLERAIDKIRLEDSAKTNFLAILAHELRNPLAPIVSSLELLRARGKFSLQEEGQLLETIESHVQTLSLLLEDLLDITRITHNKFELRREEVVLQSVFKRSLETVHTLVQARGHRLELDIPESDILLNADPVRLEQVVVNLLNNAAKYTDPGGTITLACHVRGSQAVVSITDNGIGIAPEKIGGIFELFSQVDTLARHPGGLGVGLSLAKRLVELHNGTVEATSRGLGLGSEFVVRLPLSKKAAQPFIAKRTIASLLTRKKDSTPRPSSSTRILLVDDNEPAAQTLGKLLEKSGYEIILAYDGASALALAEALKPSIIILDIGLPDTDGYTLATRLRQEIYASADTPLHLIALTGYSQEEDKLKAREAGFDAHLVKPVSIADVERVLTKTFKIS